MSGAPKGSGRVGPEALNRLDLAEVRRLLVCGFAVVDGAKLFSPPGHVHRFEVATGFGCFSAATSSSTVRASPLDGR
jgi:hypothetical protein